MNEFLCKAIGLAFSVCVLGSAVAEESGKTVRVYVLAGQSNMEGKAKLELLEHQVEAPETRDFFAHLRKDGRWVERDDVWIQFLDRKGKLTVGFGSPNCIGPELEFGNAVGNAHESPVLLIKTAWGGKSLGRDFLPPSYPLPSGEKLQEIVDRTNENQRKNNRPEVTLEEVKAQYGHFYRRMIEDVKTTLAELDQRFPALAGHRPEIAGFVWFQGWNDLFDEDYRAQYGKRLAALVRDVRKDLGVPNLPVVVGQMGQDGPDTKNASMIEIKTGQAWVATLPEFEGSVKTVRTDVFWDYKVAEAVKTWRENVEEWKKIGSDYPYHYLGSAIIFSKIGRAFGEAMLELEKKATGVR